MFLMRFADWGLDENGLITSDKSLYKVVSVAAVQVQPPPPPPAAERAQSLLQLNLLCHFP